MIIVHYIYMKVLIVSTNRHDLPFPVIPLGACMVADAARTAGHQVRLLDCMFLSDPVQAVKSALAADPPDVVALSLRNIDNNDMLSPSFFMADLPAIVTTIRADTKAPVVIGGAAVPVMPEEILRHSGADYAVMGDGEAVFPSFLDSLEQGHPSATPGIAWIGDGAFRRNDLPPAAARFHCSVPDFARWVDAGAYRRRLATIPLQTKIGCRFSCVYCTYRKIEGAEYRLADPGSVASAVTGLSARGFRDIEFVDNVFNCPHDHALEICEELRHMRHGARLQSLELNPLFVDDRLLTAMEAAGFVGMGITAESAADSVLKGLGKGFGSDEVHRAAGVVRRHRIPCLWIFLLGGPGETHETVEKTFRFAERNIRPSDAAFFNIGIRVYPGTRLESIAREQKKLDLPPGRMLDPVFYISPALDAQWLSRRAREFMLTHPNVIDSTSLRFPLLPFINRLGSRLGLRPPLWRHTKTIRRILKVTGLHP
jgi:radical SAM superfamily enzyme YgiQ (UPF0313 family)